MTTWKDVALKLFELWIANEKSIIGERAVTDEESEDFDQKVRDLRHLIAQDNPTGVVELLS